MLYYDLLELNVYEIYSVNVCGEANTLIACFVFSSKRLTQGEVVGHAALQQYVYRV